MAAVMCGDDVLQTAHVIRTLNSLLEGLQR